MAPAEVTAILDHDLAVLVGAKSGHLHRLFFSPAEEQCFVAVQDQENGDVLTVLPLDYHSSKAWEVSLEAQERAESLLLGSNRSTARAAARDARPPGREPPDAAATGGESGSSPAFRIRCYVSTPDGQLRGRGLGAMPLARVGGDLSAVPRSDDVLAEIRRRVAENLESDEVLEVVYVSRRSEMVTIEDSRRWSG